MARRLYREGIFTRQELQLTLQVLGYSPDAIRSHLLQAELEYQADYAMDLIAAYLEAYRRGQVTAEELEELLAQLPMVPERRQALISRETLKLTPKLKVPP